MRPVEVIYDELCREQRKLNMMPRVPFSALLAQSIVVDRLVVEYQRALLERDTTGRRQVV